MKDNEFQSYVLDLMQVIGPVKGRKMFGGYGLFLDRVMFALIADDVLYLKADSETSKKFDEFGLLPFVYNKKGKDVIMSYYQAPDTALEDSEVMQVWADMAYETAIKAASKKK